MSKIFDKATPEEINKEIIKLTFQIAKETIKRKIMPGKREPLIYNLDIKVKRATNSFKWWEKLLFERREDIVFSDEDAMLMHKVVNRDFTTDNTPRKFPSCRFCITPGLNPKACTNCSGDNEWEGSTSNFRQTWGDDHKVGKRTLEEFEQLKRLVPAISKTHSSYFI